MSSDNSVSSELQDGGSGGSNNRRIICLRCARIKQACDGGFPCSRCKRLDVDCERNVNGAKVVSGTSNKTKSVKITRTHTGCLTCKKRRRKCDEIKPKCSDCRRLCLDCNWPEPTVLPRRDSQHSQTGQLGMNGDAAIETVTDLQQYPDQLNEFEISFEDGMGDSSSSGDWTELWPVASQSRWANGSPNAYSAHSSDNDLSIMVLPQVPNVILDGDKSLLNHYMKIVAGVLSRRDGTRSNPYLSKLLPMAFSNQLVMDAVLALSANHWKKMQPIVWKRGIVHQTNALQSLAKLLPHIDKTTADSALAATLLLCLIELFDGTSSHWKFHLDGARRLLAAFDQKADWSTNTEFRTFCRQLYHYIDSATTISTCAPPLLEAPKDEAGSPDDGNSISSRDDIDDEAALYGIPKSLFHFVDKINSLAYQRKFREDPVFETMFQASAVSLEKELEQWSRENGGYRALDDHLSSLPPNSSFNNIELPRRPSQLHRPVGLSSTTNPPKTQIPKSNHPTRPPHPDETASQQATNAFEQALQLRLHQIVNGYSLSHEKVQQCVSRILDSIQQIRYGSPLEGCLIFPLVMAGSSCSTENERLIIQDRFLVMERTLGFRYVYTAHDLVERVWKQRDQAESGNGDGTAGGGVEVNWAAIRYYQIPGLALV